MKRTLEMKLLSIALTLIMIFVSYVAMPAKALAEEAERAVLAENIEQYAAANDFSQDNTLAYSPLVGELREERDESVKVFRRADGAQEAVIYSDPIHYLNGEVWETINNTLELVTLEDGTQAYRNKANDFIVSFSPYFNADNLITVESKGHILSWRFTEDVPFAQEESAEEAETPEAEVPEGPEQEEEQSTEKPEESETIEESEEEQGGQETSSDETKEPEAEETETPSVEAEMPDEENTEEVPSEEPIADEPAAEEPAETDPAVEESVYETLRITGAKAEITERERKEPETDEERDMLLRYPEELTSELTYQDPETGLNVHYVLSGKRLSEQIVLDHAPEKGVAYTTLLTTNDLKAEEKDGRVIFVDDNGEAIFEIMLPVMYDANGEESTDIEVQLIETEDGYAYTLLPDEKWLADAARVYPVIVDPDIRPTFHEHVEDTYVLSGHPNTNYSGQDNLQMRSNDYTLIRLTELPNLNSGDMILSASLFLSRYLNNSNYSNITITGHRITSAWDASTVTYNTKPTYESTESLFAITAINDRFSEFDITSLVKAWYDGTANYGVLLKCDGYAMFRSSRYNPNYSKHPYYSIVYRNSTGLEGNWTYYSQSAGRAGTGSVNVGSGNLTWTFSDAGIENGVLPVSLSHVYNVNDKATDIGYGNGWRLNYTQTLKRMVLDNLNEQTVYYEYIDGDGTRHYYKEDEDDRFVNEQDKNSELTFSGTTAIIEDKGGNKLIFACDTNLTHGRLTTVEDANGNQTVISYLDTTDVESLRIVSIQEKLTGNTTGQSLTLAYDANDHLEGISVPNGLDLEYTYTGSDLSAVSYADGLNTGFQYVNSCLVRATNIDGYNLRYTYNTRNGISAVTEYAGETGGESLLFEYGRSKTVIIDTQNRKTIYMLDTIGQPVSVTDSEGRAMYAAYNRTEQTVTQLSAVSKLQNTTVNLLANHGFEQSYNSLPSWTPSNTSNITVDNQERKEGLRSAKFNAAATERTLSQSVSVTCGETYTLSAYFKGNGSGQVKAITGSAVFTGDPVTGTASDWTRATVTFTATANTATVYLVVAANNNVMHADSVQLEHAATPNRYNMLENSDFANGTTGYTLNYSNINSVVQPAKENRPDLLDNHAFRFTNRMNNGYIRQTIPVEGHAGDTYSFGGWMKSTCPPMTYQWYGYMSNNTWTPVYVPIGVKELRVEFLNGYDEVRGTAAVSFAVDTSEWQYACSVAVAEVDYYKIRISVVLDRAIGETWIDGLQLYREEFSQAYSYDAQGNLTGYQSLIGQQNSFEYDNDNNVTSSTDPRGNTATYDYDGNHNLTEAKTPTGVKSAYTVNGRGQTTKTVVSHAQYNKTIETTAAYDNSTGLTSSVTDACGNTVQYDYDSATRATTTITDPKGNTSTYVYGNAAAMHRLASITSSGLGTVQYTYDTYGKLTKISRGTTEYKLTYDLWSRPVSTKVGSTALSTNTYDSHSRLSTVTYANGLSARYVYDDLDRVSKIYQTENNTEELTYEMIYNGEGDLYEIRNYRTNRASFFDYDHAGRCMASKERAFTVSNGTIAYGTELSAYGYQYDECNNLTKLTCSVLGSTWSTVYVYDSENRASTTTLQSEKTITNGYDELGRLKTRTIGLNSDYVTEIGYADVGNDRTTGLVETYQNGSDAEYAYEYDEVGNITKITQGTAEIEYKYDSASRLIRENNGVLNQTIVYDYTNELWGNLLGKKIYAYTTAEDLTGLTYTPVSYTYTNTAWGDQLTSYNGQTITYDSMGNPLTYRNNYTFTWRGKQLVGASNGTNTLSFEYNEDGLRQRKTYNNVNTDYYYNGSVLIGMQRGQTKYLFSYDAAGNVVSVKQGNNEYYYLRNAQGDIVKLIDTTGTSVVEYTYDTWGKKVTTTGSLAGTLGLFQPFRYRGYVYDWETGFYYLQSRYYDPTTGRFVSADVMLSTGQGVLGHNAFAYCLDNPVCRIDPTGYRSLLEFFKNLLQGGRSGGYTGGDPSGEGGVVGGALTSTFSSSRGTGNCTGNGASTIAGTGISTAGGIAATIQGRSEEETERMRLQQLNSEEGSSLADRLMDLPCRGSALKTDKYHNFPIYIDGMSYDAAEFSVPNGIMYQIEGSVNDISGRYEWIIENGYITHRFFVEGGTINGIPNKH